MHLIRIVVINIITLLVFCLHLSCVYATKNLYISSESLFQLKLPGADTVPAIKKPAVKKNALLKAEGSAKNLLKLVASALKFKKHADVRHRDNITSVIQEMGITDSIAATSTNIKKLTDALSQDQNQHFDSLKAIIAKISSDQKNVPEPASSEKFELTDSLINSIADKIMPLISSDDVAAPSLKEKREKISAIKDLAKRNSNLYIRVLPDNTIKRYKVNLRSTVRLFGFCDDSTFIPFSRLSYYTALFQQGPYLNSSTADISNTQGWKDSQTLTDFQHSGGRVYCSLIIDGTGEKSRFFRNAVLQQRFVNNVIALLKARDGSGINISFRRVQREYREDLSALVSYLAKSLAAIDTSYKVFITLPADYDAGVFDLDALDRFTECFFADFTASPALICEPFAKLNGKQAGTVASFFSRFGSSGISQGKLLLLVSYKATEWIQQSGGEFSFVRLIPYNDVRRLYTGNVSYDSGGSGGSSDRLEKNTFWYRAWYEDENTLSGKYDFVLENKLGGVGVCSVNDDAGYSELMDELLYKFIVTDTTALSDSAIQPVANLSVIQNLMRRLYLYRFILQNPCAVCFTKNGMSDPETIQLQTYIKELKLDSLVLQRPANKLIFSSDLTTSSSVNQTVMAIFDYVNDEFNRLILYVTICLTVLALIAAIYLVIQLRRKGNAWKSKRKFSIILTSAVLVITLLLFTWFFTNDLIPVFGTAIESSESLNCEPQPDCVNMPYSTLMFTVLVSMVIGVLIFKYITNVFSQRKNIP